MRGERLFRGSLYLHSYFREVTFFFSLAKKFFYTFREILTGKECNYTTRFFGPRSLNGHLLNSQKSPEHFWCYIVLLRKLTSTEDPSKPLSRGDKTFLYKEKKSLAFVVAKLSVFSTRNQVLLKAVQKKRTIFAMLLHDTPT